MQHAERAFIGVRGARIVCQEWLPDGDPRAVLVLVHGLAEHCCRYGNLVDHFVPRGFAVHGHDHIGHGRSGGRRVFVRRFEDLTEVLDLQIDRVRARHPAKPLFLIGHSLGALIASRFLLDRQEATSGAVLSGALVKIPPSISAPPTKPTMTGMATAATPGMTISFNAAVVAISTHFT